MVISLNILKQPKGAVSSRKRRGRGNASGHGTYSTRGLKGQRSRSGGKKGLKLKGFKQTLLNFPKYKGVKSVSPKPQVISLDQLNNHYQAGETVNPESLMAKGLITSLDQPVKILNNGAVSIKIDISGCFCSQKAVEAIKKAGGDVQVMARRSKALKKNKPNAGADQKK